MFSYSALLSHFGCFSLLGQKKSPAEEGRRSPVALLLFATDIPCLSPWNKSWFSASSGFPLYIVVWWSAKLQLRKGSRKRTHAYVESEGASKGTNILQSSLQKGKMLWTEIPQGEHQQTHLGSAEHPFKAWTCWVTYYTPLFLLLPHTLRNRIVSARLTDSYWSSFIISE